MSAIDVKAELKQYKKGWVALNPENKVIEHAMSFESIFVFVQRILHFGSVLVVKTKNKKSSQLQIVENLTHTKIN